MEKTVNCLLLLFIRILLAAYGYLSWMLILGVACGLYELAVPIGLISAAAIFLSIKYNAYPDYENEELQPSDMRTSVPPGKEAQESLQLETLITKKNASATHKVPEARKEERNGYSGTFAVGPNGLQQMDQGKGQG